MKYYEALPDGKVYQCAPDREYGWLSQHQTLIPAELSSPVSLAAQIGLNCRDILVDDPQTGVDEEPVGSREAVSDLTDFVAGALERGGKEYVWVGVGHRAGDEVDCRGPSGGVCERGRGRGRLVVGVSPERTASVERGGR